MSQLDSSVSLAIGNITKPNYITLWSSGASTGNMNANTVWSSSVIGPTLANYRKAVLINMMAGTATSSFGIVASGSNVVLDWSQDGVTGWHGASQTGISGSMTSGSIPLGTINQLGVWHQIEINYVLPYMRILITTKSGSAVSGSVAIIGYNYA